MKKLSQTLLSSLVCGCLAPSLVVAWGKHSPSKALETYEEETPKKNKEAPSPTFNANRIDVRQIEGKGIGYTRGYTTVDLFLTPYKNFDTCLPFLDARFHRFDNGKYAYNAGLGLRGISASSCRIWGINAYYDYRQTNHKHYQQVGLGLEFLGLHWDYRINGYVPLGKTESHRYDVRFDRFKGHNFFVKYKREFAMPGADAEAAYHWIPQKNIDITAALGPYYYQGRYHEFAAGGKARVEAKFLNSISIEGIASYDNFFKWNTQGQLTFAIPLGPKMKDQKIAKSCCNRPMNLQWRLVQPVERAEIIVAGTHQKDTIAINPATGQPYFFVFVNNTSHSAGTFESPYPTLLNAQSNSSPFDVIYVYSGDGSATGMNAGITLQNDQQLLGAGFSYLFPVKLGGVRNVTVPAQDSGYPLITNVGAHGVTLANNNTVLGVNIGGSTVGIAGANVTNAVIGLNLFTSQTAQTNINLVEVGGNVNIFNNTLFGVNSASSNGISMTLNATPSVNAKIQNNTMTAVAGTGINIACSGNNTVSAYIVNNALNTQGPAVGVNGINIASTGASDNQINATMSYNVIEGYNNGIQLNQANTGNGTIAAVITGNTLNGFVSGSQHANGILINQSSNTTQLNMTATNNVIVGSGSGIALNLSPTANSSVTAIVEYNTLNGFDFNGTFASPGAGFSVNTTTGVDSQLTTAITNNSITGYNDGIAFTPTVTGTTSITALIDSNVMNTGANADVGVNINQNGFNTVLTTTITNNEITNFAMGAISFSPTASGTGSTSSITALIDRNILNIAEVGILLEPNANLNAQIIATITNNTLTNCDDGIDVEPATSATSATCAVTIDIENNTLTGGSSAITVNPTAPMGHIELTAAINGNTASAYDDGITVSTSGATNSAPVTVDIENNNLNGGSNGIIISPQVTTNNFSTTVINNTVTGYTNGITLTAFGNGTVTGFLANNDVERCGAATALDLESHLAAGGTTCLNVTGNFIPSGGTLNHTGAGVFNMVSGFETNNNPQNAFIPPLGITNGVITSVPSCP